MKNRKIQTLLLLVPQLVISFILIYGVVNGLLQSLGYIPALDMYDLSLDYYIQTIADQKNLDSIVFSLWTAFVSASLSTTIGLVICYFFVNQKNLPSWTEKLVQIPVIIPHIVVAIFILQFFSRTGIIARILFALGIEGAQKLVSPLLFDQGGKGVILAYMWKEIPFIIFFSYKLISKINGSLGEAAQTLGASKWQALIYVTLPLCKKTIWVAYFMIFLFAFGAYELPSLLGPTLPQSLAQASHVYYTHPDLRTRPLAMAMNGWILVLSLVLALILLALAHGPRFIRKMKGKTSHERP